MTLARARFEIAPLRKGRNLEKSSKLALAAVAIGALALGALAIGFVAIGRLAVGRARIRRLEVDELVIRRIRRPAEMEAGAD